MDLLQGLLDVVGTIGGSDGPTAVFLAGELNTASIVASIVIGLLFCFLGLKIIRAVSGILGFAIGAGVGMAINQAAGITGLTSVIIIFACAVILAALTFFFYRLGVLLLTLSFACAMGILLLGAGDMTQLLIILVVALVLGILATIFVEPGAIIITSLLGGASAGTNIAVLAGLDDTAYIGIGISALLAVLGMAVQFFLHSRKEGKREKMRAEKFRKKDSMESEVEKARLLLDEEAEEASTDAQFDDIEILDDLDDIDDLDDADDLDDIDDLDDVDDLDDADDLDDIDDLDDVDDLDDSEDSKER